MSQEQGDEPCVDKTKKRTKRKLARYNSKEASPIVVHDALCISGGWLKQPQHIPVITIHGQGMAKVSATTVWLQQLCLGFSRGVGPVLLLLAKELRQAAHDNKLAEDAVMKAKVTYASSRRPPNVR